MVARNHDLKVRTLAVARIGDDFSICWIHPKRPQLVGPGRPHFIRLGADDNFRLRGRVRRSARPFGDLDPAAGLPSADRSSRTRAAIGAARARAARTGRLLEGGTKSFASPHVMRLETTGSRHHSKHPKMYFIPMLDVLLPGLSHWKP